MVGQETVYCTIPTSNMTSAEITTNMQKPSLESQTLYQLMLARSEGSGHSCTHFWCSWNALISVWDFYLKQDVGRITLRV